MHAVEFNVTVRNGLIALPENQKNWNGKTIKVILLESSSNRIVERFTETDDFFLLQACGLSATTSHKSRCATRRGVRHQNDTLRHEYFD